ncbi:MAG: NAD(P)H-hydrate dehydratase, partial [Pikeienuella sp.]
LLAADARGETLRQRDLAALLGISPASTSALVDRLVRDGHVRRAPHPGDRRSTAVLPTEHGHHEVRETLRVMHERMLAVASSLDEQERAVVLRFLQRLNHVLHHDVEQDEPGEGRHVAGPSSPDDPPEDADGLSAFAGEPEALFALTRGRDMALTPHMGEFARLFPDLSERLQAVAMKGPAFSRIDAAREAAARAGCVILLKGADTVVADPGGEVAVVAAHYARACPWLATAGAGDVLAGMLAGLIARGFRPYRAAIDAAWLHQEAARAFGPGLIAEDIPETLPAVLRALSAARG